MFYSVEIEASFRGRSNRKTTCTRGHPFVARNVEGHDEAHQHTSFSELVQDKG